MKWKLGALGLAAAALIFLFFTPFAPRTAVTVKVDLPPGAAEPSPYVAQTVADGAVYLMSEVVLIAILGSAVWIGLWIFRSRRRSG